MVTRYQIYNSYRQLVAEDKAKPLLCPNCEFEYVSSIGTDDEPVFECYTCGTKTILGTRSWSTIEAIVQEHVIY